MGLDKKQNIALESYENALVVRFSRPEIRNPLSVEVLQELDQIIENAAAVRSRKKLIFTGTDGIFASGANLREIARVTAATAREFAQRGQALMNKIAGLQILTLAAVNGPCFGGALDLALACDRRVAAPDAVFCHPGVGLGIMTGWGGTQRLPRLIGEARALEMFLTARRIDAAEALAIGLINRISEDPVIDQELL